MTVVARSSASGAPKTPSGGKRAIRDPEPANRRVRAFVRGELVLESLSPLLVWEPMGGPVFYVPATDMRREDIGEITTVDGFPGDWVRFDWGEIDDWYEEDDLVYGHPRDPYWRVDILHSSRTVRIEVDGVVLAGTTRPEVLFETGIRPRWYLPRVDVRMDLLERTEKVTRCPYKGQAQYWSVRVHDELINDLAWSYPTPLPESERIAGMISFYDDRVDLYLDDQLQKAPRP